MTSNHLESAEPAVLAEERLAHPNPYACAACSNRATLRLHLAGELQVTVCRPHAAAYRNGTVNRHATVTPSWQPRTPLAMPTETCTEVPLPTGPGTVAPGQRVRCMPGSLPARDGGQGGGILRSIGPKTSLVDVDGGGPRRIRNELLHPSAGPAVAAWRHGQGYRTTFPDGRTWLPSWAWLGWTVAEHQQYAAGQRHLPEPATAPQRLIIVVCGARKADRIEAPAGELYVGSYHRAARRAAEAIRTPGTRVMILSAWYGLVDLSDLLLRYDARLGQRYTISRDGLREQAEQLGLLDVTDVVVLAPAPYARLARFVWPHATCPLDGTRGMGEQLRRFVALASAAATIAPAPQAKARPTRWDRSVAGERHVIGAQGGDIHLDLARLAPPRTPIPACRARRRQTGWVTTQEPLNCPRCAVIQARRRELRRWCVMVERLARRSTPGSACRGASASSADRPRPSRGVTTGPGTRRRGGQPPQSCGPGRSRSRVVLVPGGDPVAARRSGSAYPRPPVGRAPPVSRAEDRHRQRRPDRGSTWPDATTSATTRANALTRNGSANGSPTRSLCTTRSVAQPTLTEALRPAEPEPRHLRSTPEHRSPDTAPNRKDHAVTTLTSNPADAEPSDALQAARTVRAEVTDARTIRQISRAEQDRLNADAEVERRARAAKLDLELQDARRAAARRERDAAEREKRERRKRRQVRRAARWARLTTVAPQVAEWALFTLPIMFPMAVAWVGQIRFAMEVMHWPLPAAVVFAAGFELSTAYVARLDWRARAAGDSSLLFRAATWGFAAGAAVMNYWHAAGPNFAPTGEAVSYGLMSLTGVILWELLSTYRHRTRLRAEGKLPAARPRFGLARWLYMRPITRIAWLLTVRDGYTTTDLAWRDAVDAIEQYGSAKLARQAIRRGRPASRPVAAGLDGPEQAADDHPTRDTRSTGRASHDDASRTVAPPRDSTGEPTETTASRETEPEDETTVSSETGQEDETTVDDETEPEDEVPVGPETEGDGTPAGRKTNGRDGSGKLSSATARRGTRSRSNGQRGSAAVKGNAAGLKGRRGGSGASLRAQMLAYAQVRIAQGMPVTGKELDVAFSTNNYGARILRELARTRVDGT
ncbi:DUF2637 domain-containing protein [Dactylosporangium sp. NBC_01737]|uniref:DUF6884 domain-containing protein n=1 Tax=Dactylosporangium sp. NBC_01737 TaxID=2975959 RepID=UPI002E13F32F|nr:DUF6884 domain-containing protein [Dactylosporangium sp. NBC_01737]WSG46053.1 DUF2637 domain-containing protein [Dactylosporangium sp. NBC_01737]